MSPGSLGALPPHVEIFRALGTEQDATDEYTVVEPDDPTGIHFWTERPPGEPDPRAVAPTDISPVVVMLAHPRLIPRALRASRDPGVDFVEELATNPGI